ncbi:MAG: hypothetical protein AB1782_00655 [Cyanobacteriota bacterium]
MGLAASQARLLMLTARKSDLEFQSENIAEKRMKIADEVQSLLNQEESSGNSSTQQSDGLDFGSIAQSVGGMFGPVGGAIGGIVSDMFGGIFGGSSSKSASSSSDNSIQNELAQLQEEDKKLEMKLKQIDTQHQAVQTEVDSVQKVIDKNIEQSFKILG